MCLTKKRNVPFVCTPSDVPETLVSWAFVARHPSSVKHVLTGTPSVPWWMRLSFFSRVRDPEHLTHPCCRPSLMGVKESPSLPHNKRILKSILCFYSHDSVSVPEHSINIPKRTLFLAVQPDSWSLARVLVLETFVVFPLLFCQSFLRYSLHIRAFFWQALHFS